MRVKKPSQLNIPSFVMNFPFTVDNREVNNVLMKAYADTKYNYGLAFKQFMSFYNYIAKDNLVYLLPSQGDFQDQTYVANLGVYLPHVDVIVISNYTSEPRIGEEKVGIDFFNMMGYKVVKPDTKIEGEADFKYIRDRLYIGGYGIRTDIETHDWIKEKYGAEVVSIEMTDEELYHFDCMFLKLSPYKALVVTEVINKQDLAKLEKVIEVVSVPAEDKYSAYTNSVVLGNKVLYTPGRPELRKGFEELITKQGMEPVLLDLSEFERSGAGLSCLVMRLNHVN